MLWVSQEQAPVQTAPAEAYAGGVSAERPQAMTKKARQTNHSERCNTPWRQRVARLGRETRSCSKKLVQHIGAITYFICYYNLTRVTTVALLV